MNQNIITVSSLEKSFKNVDVLKGVSFEVKKGSIFALLGSNGAGKTTIVKILSTLLRADKGKASVCDKDIYKDAEKIRESISLTGQYAAVDESLTAKENLKMIAKLRHLKNANEVADKLLETFRLEKEANRRVSTFSGGMRRRVDIAMSLVGNPQVIFLDEPTTGLDPQNRLAMWNIVKSMADSGTTIFLTTQYLEEAEYLADHIAVLHEGVIIAEGTANSLKETLSAGTVEFAFKNIDDLAKACTLLTDLRVTKDIKSLLINVITDGSAEQFSNILNRLIEAEIKIYKFAHKQPTLEEAFLNLIGENMEVASDE